MGKKFFLLMVLIAGFLPIGVLPANSQQTVIGQNNPAFDVQAVQAAVDQGGSITLKGNFDFGVKGRVNINKDVKILGETDDRGKLFTKITGGFWTFHSPLPAKLPPELPGPKITIQGIHFDGALWSPVYLAYSSGATISQNKITKVRPHPMDIPIFSKPGLNMQQGIGFYSGFAQTPMESRKYVPNTLTGNLIIEDNDIDLMNQVPTKTLGMGVLVLWTTGVTAQIKGNSLMNCSRNSIEITDNYLGKGGSGMFMIRNNKIVTPLEGVPVPSPGTPNGIVLGWFLDTSGGLDPQRNIKYAVVHNAIRSRGKASAGSVGIAAMTDGVVVVNNSILTEGMEAVALAVSSSDGYIAYNRMEGMSNAPAIYVGHRKPMKGNKNVFMENDLKHFKGSKYDVVFGKDTCDNFFIGASCKVTDLGSNNFIQLAK